MIDNIMNAFSTGGLYLFYPILWVALVFLSYAEQSFGGVYLYGGATIVYIGIILWARSRKRKMSAFEALEELGE